MHRDETTGELRQERFDGMIRDLVYMLLKHRGDFHNMLTSDYFIDEVQKNEFFYKCSAKVPFYFIHECSPSQADADVLMSKYLENPFNAVMFMHYD